MASIEPLPLPTNPPDISQSNLALNTLTDSLANTILQDASVPSPECNGKTTHSPSTIRIYSRSDLLFLHKSPLVNPPPNMPDLKQWFGTENEQTLSKKDTELPAPTNVRERRFRREAEDGDTSSRPTFRSTLSQPSQMGNFKHQSLRSDRERERDRDREGDKDRERDIRDKEGQERLRHLSDKYDRDRLSLPLTSLRAKDRDTAPHIGSSTSRAGTQAQTSNAASRRAETKESTKKKAGEASDDWRRVGDSARQSRDGGTETSRKERERSRVRDLSKSRRDSSHSRRDREKDREEGREREVVSRGDRDRDDYRKERGEHRRERETDKDGDSDDPRRWRDDGKREERLAARRAERQAATDRDRGREKAANDQLLDTSGERRWISNEDRDGRYKRSTARGGKNGLPSDDLKERDDRREREKEKEPAWMETYIPDNAASTGILGGKNDNGELDGIQTWKKGLKEKESKEKEVSGFGDTKQGFFGSSETSEKQLDEIQLFKLMMKREEEKKKKTDVDLDEDTSSGLGRSNTSILSQVFPPKALDDKSLPIVENNDLLSLSNRDSTENNTLFHSSQTSLSTPDLKDVSSFLISTNSTQDRSKTPSKSINAPAIDIAVQATEKSPTTQFNPPTGSRLLAFARAPAKSPVASNHPENVTSANGLDATHSQMKMEMQRNQPGFSPFEDRAPYAFEDQADANRGNSIERPVNSLGGITHLDSPDTNSPGYATNKGSRFAKFFDGKQREGGPPAKAPAGFASSSPSLTPRQEQAQFNGIPGGSTENRTMDDIFAMLNSSSQRGLNAHPQSAPVINNLPFGNNSQNNLHMLQQQLLHQQQMHNNARIEPLYDSRLDDRHFMPDGMVPGLRSAPVPRNRDHLSMFPDNVEEQLHFNGQRMTQQQRSMESLYAGPLMYNQQVPRNVGHTVQPMYRGAPSPSSNQPNSLQNPQRLPPGLANLGGRPPHEPSQFLGLPGLPSNALHNNHLPNGPLPQQPFNNFSAVNAPGYNSQHIRAPLPVMHQLQNPNGNPSLGVHQNHLLGMASINNPRGLNSGFAPQQVPGGPLQNPLMGIRQQQQQQQSQLPPHMLPHLIPPHLQQQQGHTGPSSQPAHDLMALLMGGPPRE